jgi:hypothetical protein
LIETWRNLSFWGNEGLDMERSVLLFGVLVGLDFWDFWDFVRERGK